MVNDDEAVGHISLRLPKGGLGRFHFREVPLYFVGLYPNITHDEKLMAIRKALELPKDERISRASY